MSNSISERPETEKPGVVVKTFGCQMNVYDSEKMLALLSHDYRSVDTPEAANVVLVNTCSVREKGEHKLFSLLGSLRDLKAERAKNAQQELIIGVAGCVAQQEGQEIFKRMPAVDFVVGTHNISLIPSLISGTRAGRRQQVAIDYRDEWEDLPDSASEGFLESSLPNYSAVRAYVAIQRGCNKNCAFCVVPNTRGPEVSRAPAEIEREVRLKVRLGAREVLLLGQTVNSYGRDLTPRLPFHQLIERLAAIEGLERIRFISPHPAEVRPEFIELYGSFPQLMPHIHLPLQSGSDRILKLMNRNYRLARYLEIIEQLKSRVPHIEISTDFIVGFPTESDEDFAASLAAIRAVQYNSVYSFIYSIRPNTEAARNFSESALVPNAVAQERLRQLQEIQEEISLRINSSKIGTTVPVLVEGKSRNISSLVKGRTPHNVQIEVVTNQHSEPEPGSIVPARVVYASAYGLRGELDQASMSAPQ